MINHLKSGSLQRLSGSTPVILWILFFCYATVSALIVQKLLLPLVPSLHGGSGLLENDATLFHNIAIKLAEAINTSGWSSWKIWPAPGATGNVGVLGALYALFGYDPTLVLPINAALHAFGGVLIYLIGRTLWPGTVGNNSGIVAATLFVVLPSSLSWYGQVHKDSYAIAGTLLLLYVWIRAITGETTKSNGFWLVFGSILGMLLVGFVRPYYVTLLFVAAALMTVVVLLFHLRRPGLPNGNILLALCLCTTLTLGAGAKAFNVAEQTYSGMGKVTGGYADALPTLAKAEHVDKAKYEWQKSSWFPGHLEEYVKNAMQARAILIYSDYNAASNIDRDIIPRSLSEVIGYLPRAMQISLLAPFPDRWFEKISVFRMVGTFETALWYCLLPGLFIALGNRRTPAMIATLVFVGFFMTVYGLTIANLGTLYRIRYPYILILMLFGLMGWLCLLYRRSPNPEKSSFATSDLPEYKAISLIVGKLRRHAAGAAMTIAVLTLLSYIAFFLRDLIAARWFGLGNELDALFTAMLLPMFMVSVFSIPFGSALIPAFLEAHERNSRDAAQILISNTCFFITAFLAVLSFLLYLLAPVLLPVIGWNFTPDKIRHAAGMMLWFLPILLCSGIVITGNSILNALGKFTFPGLAQLTVPAVAIAGLWAFGDQYGIKVIAIGMFIGQLLNLGLVGRYLTKTGYSIIPKWSAHYAPITAFIPQYAPQVASALFIAAMPLVGSALASTLASGSVATFNLGNKVVLFATGLIGTTIATVMLPYFSSLIAKDHLLEVRRELCFFLVATTLLTVPTALILYLLTDEVVTLVFEGGALGASDVNALGRVIKFGIIQLPFFTCGMLLLRFAVANRQSMMVMLASFVGLGIGTALSYPLMRHMGVAGIALATTFASVCSSGVLLMLIHRYGHIRWMDILMLGLNWSLFLTLILCLHYKSYAGVCVTVVAQVLLFTSQWSMLFSTTEIPRMSHNEA